jgi:acyl-CoA synthetase (AMP-forming)/AMP-acid ligase II
MSDDKSVARILREKIPRFADQLAIRVDGGRSLTYRDLDLLSSRVAQYLLHLGIKKRDRILVGFTNGEADRYLALYFGVHKMGGVFVPVSGRASKEEVRWQMNHSEGKILIAEDPLFEKWRESVQSYPIKSGTEFFSHLKEFPPEDPRVEVRGRDLAEILYTSGTTGTSKGIEVTHSALTAFDATPYLEFFQGKLFLDPVPLHTFAGMTYLIFPIRMGMTNLVMSKFDPVRFADLLEKEPVFAVYGVSSMFLLLLRKVPDLKKRNFSHVALVQFGAAPMPPSAVLELCDLFPNAHVTNLYGLTEGGLAGCAIPPGMTREKYRSVGQPLPGTEIRIVDESGNPLPPGKTGEILMRTKLPSRRYFKDEGATKRTWDEEGWLHTGDIGYLDEDGYLYIVDRKKDLVIRGGYNISTLEVEDAFFQHPLVAEVAVVGVPHEILGEDLVAFVVPKDPSSPPSIEELESFLRERLSDYKIPRTILFREELPKNPTGKVLKRLLREEYRMSFSSQGRTEVQ